MARTQSPGAYERQQRARAARTLRQRIDASTASAGELAHPQMIAMVAEDANLEKRTDDMVDTLAQISKFVAQKPGLSRPSVYRVLAERVIGTTPHGEITLIARTTASTLVQHPATCTCATCRIHGSGVVWFHYTSGTWHVRAADGTFRQIATPSLQDRESVRTP